MELKYYCQVKIQEILDHMLPLPDDFEVSDRFLDGLDRKDFILNFKELRDILIAVYKDMQTNPEEYGLICTSLEVQGFGVSQITGKSKGSVSWLMMLFYNLCMAGEISEDVLVINPSLYAENTKIKWVGGNKVKSPVQIINKLKDFGFIFEGLQNGKFDKKAETYILSFPENKNIIKVLKSYIMTVIGDYNSPSNATRKLNEGLEKLDYKLLIDPVLIPENQDFLDYLTYLDGDEKNFFEKLHLGLTQNGYSYSTASEYRMRYYKNDKDKNYTVECQSDNRKLFVGMKLKNMDLYSDYIQSLPEHIKNMFKRTSCRPGCTFQGATDEKCRFRVIWHVDDIEYRKCSFEDVFVPLIYNSDDVDYYVKLLVLDKQQKGK